MSLSAIAFLLREEEREEQVDHPLGAVEHSGLGSGVPALRQLTSPLWAFISLFLKGRDGPR